MYIPWLFLNSNDRDDVPLPEVSQEGWKNFYPTPSWEKCRRNIACLSQTYYLTPRRQEWLITRALEKKLLSLLFFFFFSQIILLKGGSLTNWRKTYLLKHSNFCYSIYPFSEVRLKELSDFVKLNTTQCKADTDSYRKLHMTLPLLG